MPKAITRSQEPRAQDDSQLADALSGADPARHPLLTSLGPTEMLGGDRGERRNWAIDALIHGVVGTTA